MLNSRIRVSRTKIDVADLRGMIGYLEDKSWTPVLRTTERYLFGLAGMQNTELPRPNHRHTTRDEALGGELFFRDDDVLFLSSAPEPMMYRRRIGYELPRITHYDGPIVAIGQVSRAESPKWSLLDDFAALVESAAKSALDGRKARHISFAWEEFEPGPRRLKLFLRQQEEAGATVGYSPAVLEEAGVAASKLLANRLSRETIILISRAGSAREKDVIAQKPKNQDELKESLSQMRDTGLLLSEYLVECKKAGSPIMRVRDQQVLGAGMHCPTCGTDLREEQFTPIYNLSDLGRQLTRKSHWMTVWLTDLLVSLGVQSSSILWNISEASEEVDLLVEVLGELWIFELKDREFGAGDAYPFSYRQIRFRATRGFIVTTEKVSKDARKVFEELATEGNHKPAGIVYIEGLDSARKVLEENLARAAKTYAMRLFAPIGTWARVDTQILVSIWADRGIQQLPEAIEDVDDEDVPF